MLSRVLRFFGCGKQEHLSVEQQFEKIIKKMDKKVEKLEKAFKRQPHAYRQRLRPKLKDFRYTIDVIQEGKDNYELWQYEGMIPELEYKQMVEIEEEMNSHRMSYLEWLWEASHLCHGRRQIRMEDRRRKSSIVKNASHRIYLSRKP